MGDDWDIVNCGHCNRNVLRRIYRNKIHNRGFGPAGARSFKKQRHYRWRRNSNNSSDTSDDHDSNSNSRRGSGSGGGGDGGGDGGDELLGELEREVFDDDDLRDPEPAVVSNDAGNGGDGEEDDDSEWEDEDEGGEDDGEWEDEEEDEEVMGDGDEGGEEQEESVGNNGINNAGNAGGPAPMSATRREQLLVFFAQAFMVLFDLNKRACIVLMALISFAIGKKLSLPQRRRPFRGTRLTMCDHKCATVVKLEHQLAPGYCPSCPSCGKSLGEMKAAHKKPPRFIPTIPATYFTITEQLQMLSKSATFRALLAWRREGNHMETDPDAINDICSGEVRYLYRYFSCFPVCLFAYLFSYLFV
jgi:hypothetical protein